MNITGRNKDYDEEITYQAILFSTSNGDPLWTLTNTKSVFKHSSQI